MIHTLLNMLRYATFSNCLHLLLGTSKNYHYEK